VNYKVNMHTLVNGDKPLKAICSVTVDGKLVIHNVKVVQNEKGLIVAMPNVSYKGKDGKIVRKDVCHPINREARKELEDAVLGAYNDEITLNFLNALENNNA